MSLGKMKQPQGDFDVADVEPSSCATVHGMCVSLSPQKIGKRDCRYFDGKLSDGKKTIRVISFEPKLHSKMMQLKEDKCPMAISKCSIQESNASTHVNRQYKVKISSRSGVNVSPKKNEVSASEEDTSTSVLSSLNDLCGMDLYQKVSVIGKVISVEQEGTVISKDNKELRKQDCFIADSETKCRVVLWEHSVDALKLDKTYKLSGVTLRIFDGAKYLSGSAGALFEELDDLGNVETTVNQLDERRSTSKVLCGKIIVVSSVEEYRSCLTCMCKMVKLE